MRPVALIPARQGTRRLHEKNLVEIGGKTLIAHAIEQAHEAGIFDGRIVVTTDYPQGAWGEVNAPFVWHIDRPPHLCMNETPMMPVVRHAVHQLRRWPAPPWGHDAFDAIILLQPTSPLRLPEDIRRAAERLGQADAVVSVKPAPEIEHFTLGLAGRMRPAPRQVEGFFVPDGSIFGITCQALDAGQDWWSADVTVGHIMPAARSLDIDTKVDLEEARLAWAARQ